MIMQIKLIKQIKIERSFATVKQLEEGGSFWGKGKVLFESFLHFCLAGKVMQRFVGGLYVNYVTLFNNWIENENENF